MAANYYHVGILVAKLSDAVPRFEGIFGVRFNPPSVSKAIMIANGVRSEIDVRVTYSTEAPYIELIEGQDSGYFAISQGEGLHHIGLWSPDHGCAQWRERFEGLPVEAELPSPGTCNVLLAKDACHGVRLELVDERRRADIEAWIHATNPPARK